MTTKYIKADRDLARRLGVPVGATLKCEDVHKRQTPSYGEKLIADRVYWAGTFKGGSIDITGKR